MGVWKNWEKMGKCNSKPDADKYHANSIAAVV